MSEECDYCSLEASEFVGGAYLCSWHVNFFESIPVPTFEDVAEMGLWHE